VQRKIFIKNKKRKYYAGLFSEYKANWLLLLVTFFILLIISMLNFSSVLNHYRIYYGLPISLADCCIMQREFIFFPLFIVPLCLFIIQIIIKNDLEIPFILRRFSRKSVWSAQIRKAFMCAFLFCVFYLLITLLIGSLYSSELINWKNSNSIYCLKTESIIDTTLYEVIIAFFSSCFLSIAGITTVFLLLWWIIKKSVFAWLVIIIISIWDLFFMEYSVFVGRLSITYTNWSNREIWGNFLWASILVVIMILIGRFCSRYKEFINENHAE